MYDIKEVIERLKQITNVDSNIQLAAILNVSYNTLNTWIKRAKLPQEVLIEFANRYNSSLDYLLFNKKTNQKSTSNLFNVENDNNRFIYYGNHKELNISTKAKLILNKDTLHSNAFYLLKKDNIYAIVKAEIDIINEIFYLYSQIDSKQLIKKEEFNKLNIGMIENIEDI